MLKRIGLGIFPAGILALAVMILYGIMTGASVSAMRAVCMFLLSIGAKMLGRIYDPMTALALAAILLLLDSPAYLYSSSYLLSFGAVLGVGAAAPVLCGIVGAKSRFFRGFLSSLAVNLTTLPVLLFFYGEVSVAGIVLNLAVLPTVGVVLASGAACAAAGLFSISLAGAAALPGRLLLNVYEWLSTMISGLPFCTWIGGKPEIRQIAAYYGLLLLVLLAGKHVNIVRRSLLGRGFCTALLCMGIFILGYHPAEGLKITCLDVGQGDAIVVETPERRCFLVDCGSSDRDKVGQYQILPYLKSQGISYLDAILVSHTDTDHISGIRELLRFMGEGLTAIRAGALLLPRWSERSEVYEELEVLAASAGVKVGTAGAGDVLKSGQVCFTVLAPGKDAAGTDVNEEGMVVEAGYGGFRGLFTGDIGEETEKDLLTKLRDIDFLKVAHHGSRYSTCEEFLEKVRPEIGVVSCSSSNTYGHPSPETVARLEEAGCQVEYTMKSGAVTMVTDGERLWVRRYMKKETL